MQSIHMHNDSVNAVKARLRLRYSNAYCIAHKIAQLFDDNKDSFKDVIKLAIIQDYISHHPDGDLSANKA